jgi:hypothetical protein
VLQLLRAGATVAAAMSHVGRVDRSYEYWLRSDPVFRADVAEIRKARESTSLAVASSPKQLGFAEFRRRFLHSETYPHQQNMIDVIEGRPPSWLHPAMRWERNDPNNVLINIPPDHAKTITVTIDYTTFLLATNPNERIVLVSKTLELASQMLWAVKQRFTHPKYSQLQQEFGPPEGYNSGDAQWQAHKILFPSSIRDPDEKDPSCQVVGIGGQIYGIRSTRIIVDDAVLLSNAGDHEKQRRWLEQEVVSRLGHTGQLIIVGTRVDTQDLYRELRNPDNYESGQSPWTYLGMPAILESADDSKDWVTLWPRSDRPWPGSKDLPDDDGTYPRWDGPRLARRKSIIDPRIFAMVYQQQDVSSEAIFSPADIRACMNGQRTVGKLSAENRHHGRPEGMQGLYIICSMDPAMAGETASVAYAVDPRTLKRYVLDAHRMRAPSPQAIRELIYAWTGKYEPACWMIEKNAFQLFLTRDEQVRTFLANRGCAMIEHYSGNNKLDPDFGVASLAPLFTERMIDLPSSHNSDGVKALVEQLITWRPGAKGKDLVQDLPMALWFAEIKAREVVDTRTMRAKAHVASRHVPRYRRRHQNIIHIDEYLRDELAS